MPVVSTGLGAGPGSRDTKGQGPLLETEGGQRTRDRCRQSEGAQKSGQRVQSPERAGHSA